MDRKPFETNGKNAVGVSNLPPLNVEKAEDFSGLNYVEVGEAPSQGEEAPKTAGGKRRRLISGFLVLAILALIVIGFFFWTAGSGRKKIDLPVRDRSAQAEQPTQQKIDDVTAQAIAEVRSGSGAAPSPSPAAAPSVETAAARDIAAGMNIAATSMRDIDENLSRITAAIAEADGSAREGSRIYRSLQPATMH